MPGPGAALLRSSLVPGLLLLACLVLVVPSSARAGDYDGRWVQVVRPGHSIQEAIDAARPGGWVLVLPGVYRETADATNGLNITKGIHLVGFSTRWKKVVLENSGGQRNGIVAVPSDHTDCMGCHSTLAPPFDLLPGVGPTEMAPERMIHGLAISGITIKDFGNNGLFTNHVDGFSIVDVHSVGNKNYGIFPTQSRNGIITRSSARGADDSGIWVETSENVQVTHNLVESNVNGFEVSNSERILLADNEVRGNTIGMAILFLPDIFGVRSDTRRIEVRGNHVHDNNKPNTANEEGILASVPSGTGILHVGADDSLITKNVVTGNEFIGIAVVDYCLAVSAGPFACDLDPDVAEHPGFVLDNTAENNRVVENLVVNNGKSADDPSRPFDFAKSDLGLLVEGDHGNCYAGNVFETFFSTLGVLPPCP